MEIAFFEVDDWEKSALKKKFSKHRILFFPGPLTEKEIPEISGCQIVSVFVYSCISAGILAKLPKLRLIATRSTGFDHIDLKAAAKNRVSVANVPTYGENTVAEHAFALLLSISRKIHKSYMRTMAEDYSTDGLKGFDLKGKTLGVIGAGHIGQHVIRIANGFEMKVLAYDKYPNRKLLKTLDFSYVSLDKLIKESDIISLHVPYVVENRHLFNKKTFEKMKRGVIIINTARGELIDTRALLDALYSGRVAGAGLDVIEGEELIKDEKQILHEKNRKKIRQLITDYDLMRNESVVFTPHIAFYSQEALERILSSTEENIISFINGKPLNLVKA